MNIKINLIQAKTILTKSGLPGADWVINPYNGCTFSCIYCYAAQIARWKHPDEEWGSYSDVKINASDILKKELEKYEKKFQSKNFGSIFFSSITDPYQGLEAKYKLTRKCLEALADFGYAGEVSILTKSPLVLNDIDVLKKLKNIKVGLTVTSLDDAVSGFLEVKAPPVSARLKALEKLHEEKISIYAFIGPILPHFIAQEKQIKDLLDKLEEIGVSEVWLEHINLNAKIKAHIYDFLKQKAPKFIPYFDKANTREYREELNKIIYSAMKGRKIKMGLGQVIYHKKAKK